jgi:WD40 repeat protein/tetratricopeptide (TPR) repeat protein
MAQKAICPRGHVWDPSTLAGLPPTATPRCPICGEEESSRGRNVLTRLGRWCRKEPLLAGLLALCLFLSVTLVVTIFQARNALQAARAEAAKAQLMAQHAETGLRSSLRQREHEEMQRRKRETEIQQRKKTNLENEFRAQLREAEKAASDARKQRDEQIHLRRLAEDLAQTAEQLRQDALSHRAQAMRQLVKLYVAAGTGLMENGDLSTSLLWFTAALQMAERERLPTQTHRLRLAAVFAQCPRPVQMWLHDKTLNVVQFSPDGKRMLTADANGAAEVRDAATGKRLGAVLEHEAAVTCATFAPDGKRVLTAVADKTLHLWDVETSKELFSPLQLMRPIAALAFSADGKRFLAVADKDDRQDTGPTRATEVELHVWNAANGEAIRAEALDSEIRACPARFSPDGQRVLTVCQDHCARIWDIVTGKQIGPAFVHTAELVQAAFSTDGQRVLTASVDGTARVWKTKTGEPLTPLFKHGAAVRGASLSPDGRYALTFGEDRNVRVWDVNKGEAAGPELRHAEAVSDAVFSPDGRFVLTISKDGAARLWDYRTAEEILPPLRHGNPIRYAAFTPGGESVRTLAGRVVRLWDLTVGGPLSLQAISGRAALVESASRRSEALPRGTPVPPQAPLEVFSPDGKYVLRVTEIAVRVYDTQTNQPVGGTLPHKYKVTGAAFSADGKRILTVCHQPNGEALEGHVRVWATATGELLGQPLAHPRPVLEARFSRDGQRVLTACQDGKARLWNVAKSLLIGEPMEHKQDLCRALFLPDGKHLLTVDVEGGLRLWDADTAEAVGPTWGHRQLIHHLAFSPDGQQLVTASADGTARVWQASTGREIAATPWQGAPVLQAAFSPNGKRIVTVDGDRRVRVWDAANGKPVSPPLRHRAAVAFAVFSADGKRITTVAADGLRLWEAISGEPISPLLRTPFTSARSPSKDMPLSDPLARWVRDLPVDNRPAAEWVRVAEVLSAERLTDAGETIALDDAEQSKAWQELSTKYAKDFAFSPQRLRTWHHRGALECEHQQLWIGALQHLDYLISAEPAADLYARRGRVNLGLQRWEAAQSDYTQALASKGERWDLWAGRAEAEAALGRWQEAVADYSKAIERKGDRVELWVARGRIAAAHGAWHKAAADLGKALHRGESDVTVWRQYILALWAAGDETNYRRWCDRLVQRFGDSKNETVFCNVGWTIALADGSVRDWEPLLQRAGRFAHLRRLFAVMLYRAGQFEAALKRLHEALETSPAELTAREWLVMAMAAQRLGRSEEAKQGFNKAEKLHHEKTKGDKETWEDRLTYETLHREAEILIKGSKR